MFEKKKDIIQLSLVRILENYVIINKDVCKRKNIDEFHTHKYHKQ